MPFGFPNENSITPRIKYNAKSGKAYRVDRKQDSQGNWVSEDVNITSKLVMLVDRKSMRKGWMEFGTFSEIIVTMDEDMPARPEKLDSEGKPAFKPAFKLRAKLAPDAGGDIREFSTSAYCVMESLEPLIASWSSGEHANDDLCPVLRLKESVPVKTRNGVNEVPVWEVAGWKPRPSDLVEVVKESSFDEDDDFDPGPSSPPPEDDSDLPF